MTPDTDSKENPVTLPLGPIHTLAADTIDTLGWTQGTEQNAAGQVCLTGALKACAPVPGDWLLARAVYRRRDHAEKWNDENARTAEEVTGYLRSAPVTDADLAETFGPQWEAVVALTRRAPVLTEEESHRLDAAWAAARDAAWAAARAAAWAAARDAARAAARAAAWAAAWNAAWDAARDAARDAAWDAARDATRALVVRDLIGQHGFTQEHYDLLTGPWASVIGPVHPEDTRPEPSS